MTRPGHGLAEPLEEKPFDVRDFEFFKMWKQRPAVRGWEASVEIELKDLSELEFSLNTPRTF